MLFTSLVFGLFLPIVFATYWIVYYPKRDCEVSPIRLWVQNLLIVVASYLFYGWWNWKFLLLIFFTSAWAYASGVMLDRTERTSRRKLIVGIALVVNLGILGVFKYYNFFADNVVTVLNAIGFNAYPTSLQILLPVGISFYTFQALSYVIDVYRKDIVATKDLVAFLAFVSFFPQLVAGPIERATNLLPQFLKPRQFDYLLAVEGCRQMLWGFLTKCVIADRFAAVANAVFCQSDAKAGTLIIGTVAFTVQIYGDFSGYSNIAIGCGKLFGVRLMRNFATPYFSRDIAEFWRRWHISLSTWFRDYLYIPLGGSRCGTVGKIRNTFAIFLVSGFWHGANWTFIIWGAFHAFCFLPLMLLGRNRKHVSDDGRLIPSFGRLVAIIFTFACIVFGWMIFRAPDLLSLKDWLSIVFSAQGWGECLRGLPRTIGLKDCALLGAGFFFWEWCTRTYECPLFALPRLKFVRWIIYFAVFAIIFLYMPSVGQEFIYFQF